MKKITAAAMLFLLSATGYAHHANPFWYTGVNYSILDVQLESAGQQSDAEPGAINVFVGYEFNKYLAVEGLLGRGIYDDRVSNQSFAIELDSIIGISAVGIMPLSDSFSLYGKLGFAQVEYEDDTGRTGDGSGAMYGVGAAFDISETTTFNVEYVRYPDGDYDTSNTFDIETNAFNLGVSFKF